MPFFGPRFVLTPLLAAIGAILFFIASTAGLAIGPRVLIVTPDLLHASQWPPALRPMAGFDSDPPTSAGADFNASIASITYIASTNTSLPLPTDRASCTSALPWSIVELAALGPTTNSGLWPRTGAGADASVTIASIASADTTSPLPTDRASRVSTLPWSVSGSRPNSSSIPDQSTFEHVAATGDANATVATAGVSIASTNTGVVVTSTSILDGSLQSDHHVPYHSLPSSDSIPVRLVLKHTRAIIADVSIFATNYTLAQIVASTAGDITRVFSSRHSTSIAISRALASTADADGASNTDSTTAGSERTFPAAPTVPPPGRTTAWK